jgi:hypothetical protein
VSHFDEAPSEAQVFFPLENRWMETHRRKPGGRGPFQQEQVARSDLSELSVAELTRELAERIGR